MMENGHRRLAAEPAIEKTAFQAILTDTGKSALAKYQDVALGSRSLLALLRYELLLTLLGPLPGALGLLLRKLFFRRLFGGVGKNVVFGKSLTLRHPHKIRIGNNVVIDDYAVLDAKGADNSGIVIGDNVIIGRNTVLSCKDGRLILDDNVNVAMHCFLQSGKEVRIGKNVLFSAYCYVIGGGDHMMDRTDIPIIAQGQLVRGVTIEDNCWIGAGVKIQDGVTIGRDAVIGTNAVVTRDVPAFSIAVGVPARVIRNRGEGGSLPAEAEEK